MRLPGISPVVEERKELRFCPKGKIAMPTGKSAVLFLFRQRFSFSFCGIHRVNF